jgi:hypothetical protein
LRFGRWKDVLEVGTYIVTSNDIAKFPWRRQITSAVAPDDPKMTDEVKYPEAWRRVPAAASAKAPILKFKTICRITALEITNSSKGHLFEHPVPPADVLLTVELLIRPADVGEPHACPYEVITTNQGEWRNTFGTQSCLLDHYNQTLKWTNVNIWLASYYC